MTSESVLLATWGGKASSQTKRIGEPWLGTAVETKLELIENAFPERLENEIKTCRGGGESRRERAREKSTWDVHLQRADTRLLPKVEHTLPFHLGLQPEKVMQRSPRYIPLIPPKLTGNLHGHTCDRKDETNDLATVENYPRRWPSCVRRPNVEGGPSTS